MAKQLQLRRGTTAQHSSFTGAVGEITIDTDKDTLVVHDGYTQGGEALLREDLNNLANNSVDLSKIASGTQGQVLYYNASGQLTTLNAGTAGYVLKTNGAGQNPSWGSATIDSANLMTYSGAVLKTTIYTNNTRYSFGSAYSSYQIFSFSYTKTFANSDLIIQAIIPCWNNYNGGCYLYVDMAGVATRFDGITDGGGNNGDTLAVNILQKWSGVSTGTKTIGFGWATQNGEGNYPFSVMNPNNSDDGRNRQQGSTWLITEVNP